METIPQQLEQLRNIGIGVIAALAIVLAFVLMVSIFKDRKS